MTKKPSPRNKEWEKDRRDRLNKTFDELAKLLPQYQSSTRSPSKIDILQNSIKFILNLIAKLKEISGEDSLKAFYENASKDNQENSPADAESKPKRKYTKRKSKPKPLATKESSDNNVEDAKLNYANSPPLNPSELPQESPGSVLKPIEKHKKGKFTIKKRLYKKIKRHVLETYRKRQRKFRRKSKQKREDKVPLLHDVPGEKLTSQSETTNKPCFEEINDLIQHPIQNTDLSHDLFVSLPQVASTSGSLSPTEAFLMNFPVVSGSLVSAGKGAEQVEAQLPAVESTSDRNPSETGTETNQNHSYNPSYSYSKQQQIPSDSTTTSTSKTFDGIVGSFSSSMAVLDTPFEVEKNLPFTFALTTMTASHSTTSSAPIIAQTPVTPIINFSCSDSYRISCLTQTTGSGSTLSTDTKTTNSWSYNNKKKPNPLDGHATPVADFANATPFTFSLTKSSRTESTSVPARSDPVLNAVPQVSNCNSLLFDGYNTPSLTTFPNSFLGPLSSDCQYSTNAFSFQLTSSSSSEPTYTSISASHGTNMRHAPVCTTAKRPAKPIDHPLSKKEKTTRKGATVEGVKKKPVVGDGGGLDNNNHAMSKSHVNWMTDTMRNCANDDLQLYGSSLSIGQSCNSYLPPPPVICSTANSIRGDEYTQKSSDIFFAHPGEERFLWDNDRSTRHTEFNVPQLLPPPPPPSVPFAQSDPLLFASQVPIKSTQGKHGNNNSNVGDQYQPNGNYFSVSNLVGSNKKYSNSRHQSVDNGASGKWKASSRVATWESNSHKDFQTGTQKSAASKSYSAEALIGTHQPYSGSSLNEPYKMPSYKQNSFIQDCVNQNSITAEASDPVTYNYNLQNTGSSQLEHVRTENTAKHSSSQALSMQEPFPFFHNEFMQPTLFPAPTLPLLADPSHGMKVNANKQGSGKVASVSTPQKRKTQFDEVQESQLIVPSNSTHVTGLGTGPQASYDIASSSNYYSSGSTHPQPPPFLLNPDSFNYSENCKLPQPFVAAPPPLEFNVTPPGSASNFSSNYLPNGSV